jgi:hypothetical protein
MRAAVDTGAHAMLELRIPYPEEELPCRSNADV